MSWSLIPYWHNVLHSSNLGPYSNANFKEEVCCSWYFIMHPATRFCKQSTESFLHTCTDIVREVRSSEQTGILTLTDIIWLSDSAPWFPTLGFCMFQHVLLAISQNVGSLIQLKVSKKSHISIQARFTIYLWFPGKKKKSIDSEHQEVSISAKRQFISYIFDESSL